MDYVIAYGVMLFGVALPLCGIVIIVDVVGKFFGLWKDEKNGLR